MENFKDGSGLEKDHIRQKIKYLMHRMTDREYAEFNAELKQRFFELEEVRQANTIMIYYSIAREVETVSLIEELMRRGKKVGLPVCRRDMNLDVRGITSLNQVNRRELRKVVLFEPGPGMPLISPEKLDLIIIPGMAFDLNGNRLGHGAGYYDRFLQNIPCQSFKLGLAYSFQILSETPISCHDVPVNGVLTEENYYRFFL